MAADRFSHSQEFVRSIRHYLINTPTLRAIYLDIISRSYELLLPSNRPSTPPCPSQILDYFTNHFPRIELVPTTTELGFVNKFDAPHVYREQRENILHVATGVFTEYNKRVDGTVLSRAGAGQILLITILHELEHTTSGFILKGSIAPIGVGPTAKGYGEGGWELEKMVFGVTVSLVWPKVHRGNLSQVTAVAAKYKGLRYDISGSPHNDWAIATLKAVQSSDPLPPAPFLLLPSLSPLIVPVNHRRDRLDTLLSLPSTSPVQASFSPEIGLGFVELSIGGEDDGIAIERGQDELEGEESLSSSGVGNWVKRT